MKNWIKKYQIGLIMLIPGVIGGLLYWRYVGCSTGSCPLKSNWGYMASFGGLVGFFIGDWIQELKNKKTKKNKNEEKNKEL